VSAINTIRFSKHTCEALPVQEKTQRCCYKLWNNWQCNIATWHRYLDKADCDPNAQQYSVAVAKTGRHCLV